MTVTEPANVNGITVTLTSSTGSSKTVDIIGNDIETPKNVLANYPNFTDIVAFTVKITTKRQLLV